MTVGIDLVEISRIEKSIQNPRFRTRVFGPSEQKLLNSPRAAERAAANFAAKEAFSKALGTGICGFSLSEVEVLRNEQGAPYLALSGRAKVLAEEQGLSFAVSLTHTGEYAEAVVIGYCRDEDIGRENHADLDNGTDAAGGKTGG